MSTYRRWTVVARYTADGPVERAFPRRGLCDDLSKVMRTVREWSKMEPRAGIYIREYIIHVAREGLMAGPMTERLATELERNPEREGATTRAAHRAEEVFWRVCRIADLRPQECSQVSMTAHATGGGMVSCLGSEDVARAMGLCEQPSSRTGDIDGRRYWSADVYGVWMQVTESDRHMRERIANAMAEDAGQGV